MGDNRILLKVNALSRSVFNLHNNLIFNLYPVKCENEQPIRSKRILRSTNERTENPKLRDQTDLKSSRYHCGYRDQAVGIMDIHSIQKFPALISELIQQQIAKKRILILMLVKKWIQSI